jgi:hypothetical protein
VSTALVEFVGGPLDGHQRDVPTDAEGVPQARVPVAYLDAPTPGWHVGPYGESLAKIVYERHPSPRAYGPLWLYLLKDLDI